MPPCTLGITIRNTSDICIRTNRLHFGSALRIVDHHLHVSGIIPRVSFITDAKRKESSFSLYEHNWFCISQSVTTPSVEALKHLALQDKIDTAQVHTWISRIGTSSLHLASSILAADDGDDDTNDQNSNKRHVVLAVANRVFVRRDLRDIRKAAPFSQKESQQHFERYLHESLINNNSNNNSSAAIDDILLTNLPKLMDINVKQYSDASILTDQPLLRVSIGPHHVNVGNHVDHAFLAETAAHALWKATATATAEGEQQLNNLKIQYVAEPALGQTLECHVVQVRNNDNNLVVALYQDNRNNDKSDTDFTLIAVAEQGNESR